MRGSRGFSLAEILVTLGVIGVLTAAALPSFADFVRAVRLNSKMGELTSDIALARSEAVKRNSRVLLCARNTPTGVACTAAPTAAAWMNGWLVCYDADGDGACDATTAALPNPIKRHDALVAPIALAGPTATIIFYPIGSSSGVSNFTMTAGTKTQTANVAPSGSITKSSS